MSGARLVLLTAASVTVSGCFGPFVPVVQTDGLPQAQQTALDQMRIYDPAQLPGMKFEVLDLIEGNSCQNKSNQPPASRTAAVDQLKARAAQLGADGITHIECGDREGTSIRTNCWTMISCTAEAIRLTR